MVSKIKSIKAREILDSRGNPTIEVAVTTSQGVFIAGVPSGASTGKDEAVELRDGGKRYNGRGVQKAVRNVNEIIGPKLKGKDPTRQKEIDKALVKLDGTENKSRLGANAIVGVSIAVCRAGAAAKNIPLYKYIQFCEGLTLKSKESKSPGVNKLPTANYQLPTPCFNVINGGAHAGNELDVQEFMLVPQEKKFSDNLRIGAEIYRKLKAILKKTYGPLATNVGDEGGFAPPIKTAQEALDAIMKAAENLGYEKNAKIILDVAASQCYRNGRYQMKQGVFTREGMINFYEDLLKHYPIIGLEDPFGEEDWQGWRSLKSKIKNQISKTNIKNQKLLIIGDDLLVTNSKRIKIAHEKDACNAMILKVNQIGTVTEALEAARLAKSYGWKIIVSHRSGETCDDFIADLAVGIGADYIKSGAPARGERVAKYNRLLQIEKEGYLLENGGKI